MIRYHRYKNKKTMDITFYNIIFVGVCIGVVFFIIYFKWTSYHVNDWNMTNDFSMTTQETSRYLYFVIKQRTKDILMILMGTFLTGHKRISRIMALLLGVCSGFLLCMCVQRYVVKGLILWLAYQLPHYICYILGLYLWGEMEATYPINMSEIGYNKTYYFKKILQYIIVLLLIIAGIIAECYVNTGIMEKVIKIFKYE